MGIEEHARALQGYLVDHDTSFLADDAVFVDQNSGQQAVGHEAIQAMLDWVYHVAFDGRFEPTDTVIGEGGAATHGTFVGRHIGEFAGVRPTGAEVRIPMAVVYGFRDGRISRGDVYMAVGAFFGQVAGAGASA